MKQARNLVRIRRPLLWGVFFFCLSAVVWGGGCYRSIWVDHRITPQVDPWVSFREVATICVLRHQKDMNRRRYFHYNNGHLVGVTEANGAYFCYLARAGLHHLVARHGPYASTLSFSVRAEQRYYVQFIRAEGTPQLFPLRESMARHILPHLLYAYARINSRRVSLERMPIPALVAYNPYEPPRTKHF